MLTLVIAANVGVYALMAAATGTFTFDADTLLGWGGNLGALSLHGEPWRLVSALFLHAGPAHILGNMALLAITGLVLEARVGPWRALSTYMLCGLAGSLLSAAVHPETVSIGASGAIAGLLGAMVALYLAGEVPKVRGAWIAQVVGINAIYSFAPDVDWAAHAAGFAAGLLAGGVLLWRGLPEKVS